MVKQIEVFEVEMGSLPMVCAAEEAAKRRYHMVVDGPQSKGKKHKVVWLYAAGEYAADNIYHGSTDPNSRSEGFGGAALKFDLVGGGDVTLYGPWHSNAESLYQSTGVDIRNKHRTFVVVSAEREYSGVGNYRMIDVLFVDADWKESRYDRGDRIAKTWANKLNKPVYVYQQGGGGAHLAQVKPD